MMKQAVRLTLLTIALAAVAAAAWSVWTADQQLTVAANAARQVQASGGRAVAAIADLRAAQQSYVAADQGDAFWSGRVTAILGELNDSIASLKSSSASSDAAAAFDEASSELQSFTEVDRRARELTRAKQFTPASDLIYSEGFDQATKGSAAIERGVAAELSSRDASAHALRRRTVTTAGAAAGIVVLVAIGLTPVPRRRPETLPAPETAAATYAKLLATSAATATPQPKRSSLDLSVSVRERPGRLPIDLGGIAALCAEFARVADPSVLPPLLGRASDILDAAGIVVWIADPDGRELFPTIVHGYPPQVATRLGTLSRDAENVTASAFRTGLLQIVKATTASNGAVAAPLVGPTGTLGVIAAELRSGGEQQDVRRAAVAIVAAQIATLVGPPSGRTTRTEAAG